MRSGWIGAAAVIRMCAWSRPSSWRILRCRPRRRAASYGSFSHSGRVPSTVSCSATTCSARARRSGRRRAFFTPCASPSFAEHRLLELLPDAGHREEDGRPAVAQVLGDRRQAAREPRLPADGDGGEVAHHALGDVRQRQEREEALALADVRRTTTALRIVHMMLAWLIIVPFGRAGRAARVDERGQLLGLDRVRPLVEQVGLAVQAGRADRAQLREADDERVVEPVVVLEDDDAVELRAARSRTSRIRASELVVLDEADARLGVAEDVARPVRVSSSGTAGRSRCRWPASPKSARCHSSRLLEKMPTCWPGIDPELGQAGGDLADRPAVVGPGQVSQAEPSRRVRRRRSAGRSGSAGRSARSASTMVAPSMRNGDAGGVAGGNFGVDVHDVPPEWNGSVLPVLRPARGCDRVRWWRAPRPAPAPVGRGRCDRLSVLRGHARAAAAGAPATDQAEHQQPAPRSASAPGTHHVAIVIMRPWSRALSAIVP